VTKYITVKLPQDVGQQIDDLIKRTKLGYSSRAEFVKDAIRDKILNIKENSQKGSA
jgi:metal-responsive CopG/Arc/MetJ family transcriptional regulator